MEPWKNQVEIILKEESKNEMNKEKDLGNDNTSTKQTWAGSRAQGTSLKLYDTESSHFYCDPWIYSNFLYKFEVRKEVLSSED